MIGFTGTDTDTTACEVLNLNGCDERWEPLPPMHDARIDTACAAVGGCVIVAGGCGEGTVCTLSKCTRRQALGRWRRLPCSLPVGAGLLFTGSALMR